MTFPLDPADLTVMIIRLTHNTSYMVNISAWTVRQGEPGSLSFTTIPCKYYTYICIERVRCIMYNLISDFSTITTIECDSYYWWNVTSTCCRLGITQ